MKTLRKQISKNGEVKSIFLQEDSPASHSVLQEKERERKITATSGRKCYGQYGKFSPLGLLVKTLMESSQWYSPAKRLRWDVQTICSTRISYTERNRNSQLKSSVKTLREQVIPVQPIVIPACAVGAPHRRDRVWIVAKLTTDTDCRRCAGRGSQTCKREKTSKRASLFSNIERPCGEQDVANSANARSESVQQGRKDRISEFGVVAHAKGARSALELFGKQEQIQSDRQNCRIDKSDFRCFPTQSPICNRNDGLPFRMADLTISFPKWRSKSIEALGNAWVPQVAFEIFKAINEIQKKSV